MNRNLAISLVFCLLQFGCSNNLANSVSSLTTVGIHDIQGCSHVSPMINKMVSDVNGVVTQKFSAGFTIESLVPDDKPCTSEGIFIYTAEYPDVSIGDIVSVSGKVDEFSAGNQDDFNLSRTEIHDPNIRTIGRSVALPDPVILGEPNHSVPDKVIEDDQLKQFDIDTDGIDYYESLEFMRIRVENGTVVSPRNSYNEIVVLPELFSNLNFIASNGSLIETSKDKNPEKIMVKMPANQTDLIMAGDILDSAITGVLDYSFGNYKIVSESNVLTQQKEIVFPVFTSINKNNFTIATYNVENMSRFDESSKFTNLARQIVENLASPDVLILNEIMDDSGVTDDGTVNSEKTLQKLVDAIKKKGVVYNFSDNPPFNDQDGGVSGGNIRTIVLYRSDRGVTLVHVNKGKQGLRFEEGIWKISSNPLRIGNNSEYFTGTRKPAIWLFEKDSSQVLVVGIHLVSNNLNSPDWGSVQPPQKPEELKRIAQAKFISNYADDLLAKHPMTNLIIAGDLNDVPWSAAFTNLADNQLINAVSRYQKENYSYIYEGNAFQFDYLFVSTYINAGVKQAEFLHINSLLDAKKRFSDHDPVILEIELNH
jgi:uncharacterized protein